MQESLKQLVNCLALAKACSYPHANPAQVQCHQSLIVLIHKAIHFDWLPEKQYLMVSKVHENCLEE